MKVGFISIENAQDKNSWSGTLYYFSNSLKRYCEVLYISPLSSKSKLIYKPFYRLMQYITGKQYMEDRSILLAKSYGMKIDRFIKKNNLDMVISMSSIPLPYIKSGIPIICYTDATFKPMVNYYPFFTNLSKYTLKRGNYLEKKALDNCSLVFYSSDWARQSAINDYNVSAEKVFTIPFGLNMDKCPSAEEVYKWIRRKKIDTCNLLFVGKDFQRKGGDTAVQTVRYLNEQKGIRSRLTIIGCNPDISDKYVEVIPYINKNNKKEHDRYLKLLKESSFLILPTRADCTPMVCVEANAFGLPVLTTETGGLSSIVENNVNGFKFSLEDDGSQYGEYIAEVLTQKNGYLDLCFSSRKHYEQNTNWDNTCKFIIDKCQTIINKERKWVKKSYSMEVKNEGI